MSAPHWGRWALHLRRLGGERDRLICALTRAEPAFAERGARAFAGPPVFYISADSHLAWIKIAHTAGIGRAAARLVPTDGNGRARRRDRRPRPPQAGRTFHGYGDTPCNTPVIDFRNAVFP